MHHQHSQHHTPWKKSIFCILARATIRLFICGECHLFRLNKCRQEKKYMPWKLVFSFYYPVVGFLWCLAGLYCSILSPIVHVIFCCCCFLVTAFHIEKLSGENMQCKLFWVSREILLLAHELTRRRSALVAITREAGMRLCSLTFRLRLLWLAKLRQPRKNLSFEKRFEWRKNFSKCIILLANIKFMMVCQPPFVGRKMGHKGMKIEIFLMKRNGRTMQTGMKICLNSSNK